MSFAPRLMVSLLQGAVYTCFVGGSYNMFVDEKWDLDNIPKLAGFWLAFAVPSGILWTRINARMFAAFRLKREIVWSLATFNKKALALDFIMNHVLYQSIFVFAFFEYCKRVFPKAHAIQTQATQQTQKLQDPFSPVEEKQEEPKDINDELYSKENLLSIVKLRLKIALGSYFIDMWAPWVSGRYIRDPRIKFFKDMILGLVWNVGLLSRYYYPGEQLSPYEERVESEKKRKQKEEEEEERKL